MKTVIQALKDDIIWPVPLGKIENIVIKRNLWAGEEYTSEIADTPSYKGALADCLYSLIQSYTFSEAGMSVGALTDQQRKAILKRANGLYKDIGEEEKEDSENPTVYINC